VLDPLGKSWNEKRAGAGGPNYKRSRLPREGLPAEAGRIQDGHFVARLLVSRVLMAEVVVSKHLACCAVDAFPGGGLCRSPAPLLRIIAFRGIVGPAERVGGGCLRGNGRTLTLGFSPLFFLPALRRRGIVEGKFVGRGRREFDTRGVYSTRDDWS
jgi:hypothetical protein